MRRPSAGNEAASERRSQAVDPPLVHFHQDQPDPDQQSVNRDFALALVKMARQPRPPEQRRNYGSRARSSLEAALNQRPDDLEARHALGYALWLDVKTDEALAAFKAVLEKAPEHEETLVDAATLTESLKRPDPAIDYWRRAIAVNPWMADYRWHLAQLLAEKKDWPAARDECLATLRFHPRSGNLRKLLIRSYLQTGQQQQARQEFETLLSLNPNSQGELRQWFAAQTPE